MAKESGNLTTTNVGTSQINGIISLVTREANRAGLRSWIPKLRKEHRTFSYSFAQVRVETNYVKGLIIPRQ